MKILGVKIDKFNRKEILQKVEFFLAENKFHQIATINPEFILLAQDDSEFRDILNQSALSVVDGIGLKFASWLSFQRAPKRFTGADLLQKILEIAKKKQLEIFLANNKDGLSSLEQIKKSLIQKYPNLKVTGKDLDRKNVSQKLDIQSLIVFCNFGAPWQEKFLNCQKNDTIRLAMGVGGAFDFLTRKTQRAPKWMQKFGLEWIWRWLQTQKTSKSQKVKRGQRIFRSVIVFPWKVIFDKIRTYDKKN